MLVTVNMQNHPMTYCSLRMVGDTSPVGNTLSFEALASVGHFSLTT